MTAPIPTLNVSAAQIEADLRAGRTVDQIVADWSEPKPNVIAVLRALQAREPKPPAPPVAGDQRRPLTSVPTSPTEPAVGLSVDALVSAAARSTSKRTQVLGVRLADLTTVVRDRLADERRVAEEAEATRAEREKAAADVARLEAQLADARAKLRPSKQQGGVSVSSRKGQPLTAEKRAKMLAGQRNSEPCARGCGFVGKTKSGKSAHERFCTGSAS